MIYSLTSGLHVYEIATRGDRPWGLAACARMPDARSLVSNPQNVDVMRRVLSREDHSSSPGGDGMDVANRFERLVARGAVTLRHVIARPSLATFTRTSDDQRQEGSPLVELAVTHFVEFRFIDAAGQPIGELPYALYYPTGDPTSGTLAKDGRVRADNVDDGCYGVELKEVESVVWGAEQAGCDDELAIYGRVSGYPDGTQVKVSIYREFSETDDDVLDSFEAEVQDAGVAATWQYDYSSDESRAEEQGDIKLIAELSVDDGASWAKTIAPIVVALKSVAIVDWDRESTGLGTQVELFAEVSGFSADASVQMHIYKVSAQGNAEHLETLEGLAITEGRITTNWVAPDVATECYFELAIDDVIVRTAMSDLVWVH